MGMRSGFIGSLRKTLRVAGCVLPGALVPPGAFAQASPATQVQVPGPRVAVHLPCRNVRLFDASVVRYLQPTSSGGGVPTYHGRISLSGTTWTVKVPAEAYGPQAPYQVRFSFRVEQGEAPPYEHLDAYHPALQVLTKSQAESLGYLARPGGVLNNACFLKVTIPAGQQLGSMPGTGGTLFRDVTDHWPVTVTLNGQYGLQIWYFQASGAFTKVGDFAIRLEACTPRTDNRYYCQ